MQIDLKAVAGKASNEIISYDDRVHLVEKTILTDDQTRQLCGSIKVELVTGKSFLIHN